jgi:hypothetical protein
MDVHISHLAHGTMMFRCRPSNVLETLARLFCTRHGLEAERVRFFKAGQRVTPAWTLEQSVLRARRRCLHCSGRAVADCHDGSVLMTTLGAVTVLAL